MQGGVFDPLLNVSRVLGQVALEFNTPFLQAVLESSHLAKSSLQLVLTFVLLPSDSTVIGQVRCGSDTAAVDKSEVSQGFTLIATWSQKNATQVARSRAFERLRGISRYLQSATTLLHVTHVRPSQLGNLNTLLCPIPGVHYPQSVMETEHPPTWLLAVLAVKISLPASRRYLGEDSEDVRFHRAISRSPTVSKKNALAGKGADAGLDVERVSYQGTPSSSTLATAVLRSTFTSSSARSRSRRRRSSFSLRRSSSSSRRREDFECSLCLLRSSLLSYLSLR